MGLENKPGGDTTMTDRVHMPARLRIADDEIDLSHTTPQTGQRISMILADDVFRRMGKEAIAHAVVRLGESVVYTHQHEIERAVHSYILDREWAEPIIKKAITECVYRVIHDIFTGDQILPGGDTRTPDKERATGEKSRFVADSSAGSTGAPPGKD